MDQNDHPDEMFPLARQLWRRQDRLGGRAAARLATGIMRRAAIGRRHWPLLDRLAGRAAARAGGSYPALDMAMVPAGVGAPQAAAGGLASTGPSSTPLRRAVAVAGPIPLQRDAGTPAPGAAPAAAPSGATGTGLPVARASIERSLPAPAIAAPPKPARPAAIAGERAGADAPVASVAATVAVASGGRAAPVTGSSLDLQPASQGRADSRAARPLARAAAAATDPAPVGPVMRSVSVSGGRPLQRQVSRAERTSGVAAAPLPADSQPVVRPAPTSAAVPAGRAPAPTATGGAIALRDSMPASESDGTAATQAATPDRFPPARAWRGRLNLASSLVQRHRRMAGGAMAPAVPGTSPSVSRGASATADVRPPVVVAATAPLPVSAPPTVARSTVSARDADPRSAEATTALEPRTSRTGSDRPVSAQAVGPMRAALPAAGTPPATVRLRATQPARPVPRSPSAGVAPLRVMRQPEGMGPRPMVGAPEVVVVPTVPAPIPAAPLPNTMPIGAPPTDRLRAGPDANVDSPGGAPSITGPFSPPAPPGAAAPPVVTQSQVVLAAEQIAGRRTEEGAASSGRLKLSQAELERLADAVYEIIERRLLSEREALGL